MNHNIAEKNRKESYDKSKEQFSEQERYVLKCLALGYDHAWSIQEASRINPHEKTMLITRVRRCLTNLVDKDVIYECGTVFYSPTERNVTRYKIKPVRTKLF